MYFIMPYLFANYGIFLIEQRKLFEQGYPAHPFIIEKRARILSRCCFKYPKIIKNEIEYLHAKIHEFPAEPTNEYLV